MKVLVMAVIIFDVGNVIIKCDQAISEKILAGYGVSHHAAKAIFTDPLYREYSRGSISSHEFSSKMISQHFKKPLTENQVRHAHDQHMFAVDKEVLALMEKLSINHRIAIATDTNDWQTARERQLIDLSKFAAWEFRSHEMHLLKTEKAYWLRVMHDLGEKPANIFYIDDSSEKLKVAEKFGIRCIHFENPAELARSLRHNSLI